MQIAGETFAEKYDLYGCIQCGKCTGGCAISLKSRLNIRRLLYEAIMRESNESIFARPELWDCTTCATCSIRCPKGVDPVEVIIGMRSLLVEEGRIETTIKDALESTFKHGNPWGRIRDKRSEWQEGLEIKNFSEGQSAQILYFVGCTPAYDPRLQEVAKAMVKCFNKAKVDFGTLGNEETCCGNEIRRMGEEGLFEMLVEDNSALFKKYKVQRMVTISPHCYNTFKNEYPEIEFQVQHYTQFVAELIEQGTLTFSRRRRGSPLATGKVEKVVTYQDPCFLGKQNEVYDEPRRIIESIPGIKFVDMDRSRERSLCCEGGGGRMWVEAASEGERLGEVRVKDAVDMGAQVLATACPFCLLTLEDAVKTTGLEEKIQIKDIMELVAEAI